MVFGRFHLSLDQSHSRCTFNSLGYPTMEASVQIPSFDMALNNRLREQPSCLPRDVLSLLLSPTNRASFSHALGFAWPDWSLYGRQVARHRAGGYENHLDEIGFVDDKTPMALSPTLSDRVFFEGAALDKRPLRLS